MKTRTTFILSLTVIITLAAGSAFGAYSGGGGTAGAPYQIATKTDLLDLAANTADYGLCFILTADIDMGGQVFTTAIIAPDTNPYSDGFQGTAFTGTFDGNGHKVTNFTTNGLNYSGESNSYLGLFGQVNTGGSVKNLGLENYSASGIEFVGGLVGYNNGGSISNCYSTGPVSGFQSVGGLVGENVGSISNCYSTGAISGFSSSSRVGGLVGENVGSISNCYSTGAISGYSRSGVGGLVGYNNGGSISNCYSTGAVSIANASMPSGVGGLVGSNSGSISNCYSTGSVSGGFMSSYVGGLVGCNGVPFGSTGNISNCYSTGAVSGTSNVGGLVGYKYSGSISNCYFLITSGPNNSYGTPLTDAQMKQQSNFVGWDFTNETANGTNDYWRMCVNGVNYPHLNWESIDGDFACPDGMNFVDFAYFAGRWQTTGCNSSNNYCGGADMDTSGTVDMADFAMFAENWLEGVTP